MTTFRPKPLWLLFGVAALPVLSGCISFDIDKIRPLGDSGCQWQVTNETNLNILLLQTDYQGHVGFGNNPDCWKARLDEIWARAEAETLAEKDKITHTAATNASATLLIEHWMTGNLVQREETLDIILAEYNKENAAFDEKLSDKNLDPNKLLAERVISLLDIVEKGTPEKANEARGDIISIHNGTFYPRYEDVAPVIVDHVLAGKDLTIENIKDQYLERKEKSFQCLPEKGVMNCKFSTSPEGTNSTSMSPYGALRLGLSS